MVLIAIGVKRVHLFLKAASWVTSKELLQGTDLHEICRCNPSMCPGVCKQNTPREHTYVG